MKATDRNAQRRDTTTYFARPEGSSNGHRTGGQRQASACGCN